jgi:two-component system response regulator HupR/HoxA
MTAIRSVLWVGSAEGLARSGLPESARHDVVWEPELAAARRHDLAAFHTVVLETSDPELRFDAPAAVEVVRVPPHAVGRVLERRTSEIVADRAENDPPAYGVIASSEPLRRVLALAIRIAPSAAPVLVTGETGTGKERIARAVHEASRRTGPFIAVNCAALPETLLESELFGHRRGAFSGADRDRKGLIESAAGGTVFLDEIGEASPSAQAKLLRVLQERRVRPLGSAQEREVDVRFVTATHRDLLRGVREGHFREDLYYRLAVLLLAVPPLRERPDDIRPLVRHLIVRDAKANAGAHDPTPEAWAQLEAHAWPGNVRELENEVTRALALADPGEPLQPKHFSERLGASFAPIANLPLDAHPGEPLRDTLDRVERWLVHDTLRRNGGHRARTARQLGVTREGLYKKMKRLGIE